MKIFIDTAKLSEIKEANSWGIVDGVTTNPSLIKKAIEEIGDNIEMDEYIEQICSTVNGPVSLEVIGLTDEEMYREAKILYEKFNPIKNNVVIKIPICTYQEGRYFDSLKTIKKLSDERIPVNTTLIMTPEQALLAAKAGAKYVSPFAGRIDDYIRSKLEMEFEKFDYFPCDGITKDGETVSDDGIVSGVDLIKKCVDILKIYEFDTEVIAASIRNPRQVREIALTGAHIATIPFNVLYQMIQHFKTKEGVKKFLEDVVPEYKKLFE